MENDNSKLEMISNINDKIYQGDMIASMNFSLLKSLEITHILVAANLKEYFPDKFKYLKLDIIDKEDEYIFFHFDTAYKFISECLESGGKIYIHCAAGSSRSSAITICYLIKSLNIDDIAALKIVQEKRPIANPNKGFREQLHLWYLQEVKKIDVTIMLDNFLMNSYNICYT